MTFGLTYWFGATGSTLIADLNRLASMRLAAVAGLVGVLVGLGFKAGLVPFHFWVPDAYDGGPLSVAAYLSVVPKVGAVFALAEVARNLPPDIANWRFGVAGLAVASMVYGNLAALPQTNVVRLLAYSSIAQSGYLIFGIAALGRSELAMRSLVVFAAAYAAMNIGMFSVIAIVGRTLTDFTGVGRARPWLGAATVIFLLSLVGIPPLAGFIGKFLLFGAAIDAQFTWLAVVGILNSVLSLAVYLRIIVPMYQPPRETPTYGRLASSVLFASLILTIGIGLAAQGLAERIT
jgi:NADH-quinone oxidoreductase subunit N